MFQKKPTDTVDVVAQYLINNYNKAFLYSTNKPDLTKHLLGFVSDCNPEQKTINGKTGWEVDACTKIGPLPGSVLNPIGDASVFTYHPMLDISVNFKVTIFLFPFLRMEWKYPALHKTIKSFNVYIRAVNLLDKLLLPFL